MRYIHLQGYKMHTIDLFVKNWASKNTMAPINKNDILDVESKLNAFLPKAYKYLISTYGLVHTPNVFSKVCDLDSGISEVQDFLGLSDVYSLSQLYEMSGMPKGHILFASDCKGNMFCFRLADCLEQKMDAPVCFFDHNASTITQISNSFSEWLDTFNRL